MRVSGYRNLFTLWAAGGMLLGMTAACSKDDEPSKGKDDIRNRVYQQYEVRITDGSAIAYANLRRASASGERVRLSGQSALMVNGTEMYYTQPVTPEIPEFTYALPLEPDATAATFLLKVNSEFSLNNTLRLADIPEVKYSLTDNTLSSSSTLHIDMTGVMPEEVTVSLSASPMADASLTIGGAVSAGGIVVFDHLPAPGQYYLTVSSTRVFSTVNNDGAAGGTIRGVRSTTRRINVAE